MTDVTDATAARDSAATETAPTEPEAAGVGTALTDTAVLPPVPAGAPPMSGPPAAPATLEARAVSAWFGSHQVLERVSSPCPPGRSPP